MGVNARGCYLCLRAEIRQMLLQSPPTASVSIAESEDEGPRVAIDRLNYTIVNIRLSCFTNNMTALNKPSTHRVCAYAFPV